ncbi:MAG: hypothetical protein LBS54_01910 [Dysgonamonadaceae bacterium]|nr:hypothetical protein [Dysgonamonadaceae bacterium]
MTKKNLLLLAAIACTIICCSCQPSDNPASVISKHVIRFNEPPRRIPSKVSVDAPLLGNGYMGVALAGQPERQIFYIARNDFWRLKSAHNESYPLALGKLEISIPDLAGAEYLVEQNIYDAITEARFIKGDTTVVYKTFLAATDDILSVEISMEGKGELPGYLRLIAAGSVEYDNIDYHRPIDRPFPGVHETGYGDGVFYATRAFEDSVDIPTKASIALRLTGDDNIRSQEEPGKFVLKQGRPVSFVLATSSNFKSENPKLTATEKVNNVTGKDYLNVLKKQHREWWHDYWAKSWVSIPDSAIERLYYLSLYGTASCCRDKDFPPGLLGTWVTKEQPAWMADYHLNYNFQAPFYALYSANRTEQAEPFYSPILAFMERGKYYSEKISGIPDGVIYPVGIGPLGIETTRWSDAMEQAVPSWRKSNNIQYGGMFWGQKSNASYCVVNMAFHFYRTFDEEFTNKVYPFVKACATFWENYVKWETGRYVIYNDAIHEGTTLEDFNPILSLGFVRQTMQTALDMSELLGKDADRRDKWTHIRDNIAESPLMERDGKTVFRLSERGFDLCDGNSLALQHIYPGEQVGLGSPPKTLEIARNTIKYKNFLDGNASNSIFPTAVRIGLDPDTITEHLNRYAAHTFTNGFQLDNPHGVENWSTVPNTINEMLCMGHQGITRLFPVWSRKKDAQFHNIRTVGAFLISASLTAGEVNKVSVFSEKGKTLNMLNPWSGRKVRVTSVDSDTIYEGDTLHIITKQNTKYSISPQ